ncbi:MAG: HemK2/MTQ2 family protein methyltransferase [Candidatus Helarchaeota archaeon]
MKLLKFYHRFLVSSNVIQVKGKKFLRNPNVLAPSELVVTNLFLIENLLVKKGDNVLDLGTGSGIMAIFCANKAEKVIATDINPFAVELTKKNVKLNKLDNIEVRFGDLFEGINEKFDLILFNPPYFPVNANKKNFIEVATCCGKNYELIQRFAIGAKKCLNKNGRIELILSTLADLKNIKSIFIKQGYNIKEVAEKNLFFEKFVIYLLKLNN